MPDYFDLAFASLDGKAAYVGRRGRTELWRCNDKFYTARYINDTVYAPGVVQEADENVLAEFFKRD